MDEIKRLRAENEALQDKALRFDLDQAGIEGREREAVELVEKRAEVEALRSLNERLHAEKIELLAVIDGLERLLTDVDEVCEP